MSCLININLQRRARLSLWLAGACVVLAGLPQTVNAAALSVSLPTVQLPCAQGKPRHRSRADYDVSYSLGVLTFESTVQAKREVRFAPESVTSVQNDGHQTYVFAVGAARTGSITTDPHGQISATSITGAGESFHCGSALGASVAYAEPGPFVGGQLVALSQPIAVTCRTRASSELGVDWVNAKPASLRMLDDRGFTVSLTSSQVVATMPGQQQIDGQSQQRSVVRLRGVGWIDHYLDQRNSPNQIARVSIHIDTDGFATMVQADSGTDGPNRFLRCLPVIE